MSDESLKKLHAVDWEDAAPRLLAFARYWSMAHYGWRPGEGLPEGRSVEDVVKEAVSAFSTGKRTLNASLDVLSQLKGAIRSILWNVHSKKSAALTSLEEPAFFDEQLAAVPDPASKVASEDFCQAFLAGLRADERVKRNGELLLVVKAHEEGAETVPDLVDYTQLPVEKIYELRRQLKGIATQLLARLHRKETRI